MHKNNPLYTRSEPAKKLTTRSTMGIVPKSLREEDRSVEFVASTERPVRVFDWERGEPVDEVLLSSGLIIPANGQVPFQDAHARNSVADTLGSMRQFRDESGMKIGRAFFSRKPKAVEAFQDVQDGHLTDVSVGYEPTASAYIPRGETQIIQGRSYSGPVKVTTRAILKEVSLCAVGADPDAKVRAEQAFEPIPEPGANRVTENSKGGHTMNPKLFALLISRGLAPGSSVQEAEAFLSKMTEEHQKEVSAEAEAPEKKPETPPQVDRAEIERKAIERATQIRETVRAVGLPETMADDLVKRNLSIEEASREILLAHAKTKPAIPAGVRVVAEEKDKLFAAVTDGLALRHNLKLEKDRQPASGHETFRYRSLLQIAEEVLRINNIECRGWDKSRIAEVALGKRGEYPILPMTTANFPAICENIANKAMLQGFTEAPAKWRAFCRVGNIPDFKNNTRVILSDAPNLELKAEGAEYKWGVFSDKKETYAIGTYAKKTGITRETIVNDDQDALSAIPMAYGYAAARIPDALAFAILTSNPNMVDGSPLFDAAHANTSTGVLSTTSVSALRNKLRLQTGFGTNAAYLDIEMAVLLVPVELEFSADIICNASALPEASYSSLVPNPLQRKGIAVVSSPRLSADSTVEFYGAADPNAFPTIEVGFLDGRQTPELFRVDQTDPDGVVFKIRLDCGAKALDFRGLAYSTGA